MTMLHKSVGHGFERALKGVYGHSLFGVDEIDAHSAYRVREDPDHFLGLSTFYTRGLNTVRPASGLSARWAGQFFVMRQSSGQLRLRFDDAAPVLLRAGDVLLMNPYSQCEYLSQRANEVAVFPLPFDLVGDEDAVLAACGRCVATGSGVGAVLGPALGALCGSAAPDDPEDQAAMRDVVRNLLRRVIARAPDADGKAPGSDGLMRRAQRFALMHLANPALSPDTIAAGIGVSRRHLYRAFSEHGQTPGNWLWRLRTEQAHARLTAPDAQARSLTELAFDVGFSDMAHFSRSYRARFGCTPREARLAALAQSPC